MPKQKPRSSDTHFFSLCSQDPAFLSQHKDLIQKAKKIEGYNIDTMFIDGYLNQAQRSQTRVVADGERLHINGLPLHGVYMYIMDENGQLFVSNLAHKNRVGNHNYFNRGRSVICAGVLVAEHGYLKLINNNSGHYKPGWGALRILLNKLDKIVNINPLIVEDHSVLTQGAPKMISYMAQDILRAGVTQDDRRPPACCHFRWYSAIERFMSGQPLERINFLYRLALGSRFTGNLMQIPLQNSAAEQPKIQADDVSVVYVDKQTLNSIM